MTTPWPDIAASPWISTGTTLNVFWCRRIDVAWRAADPTTGSTASRCDGLAVKVRWMLLPAGGDVVGREAQVVFHITVAVHHRQVVAFFEFGEHRFVGFVQHVYRARSGDHGAPCQRPFRSRLRRRRFRPGHPGRELAIHRLPAEAFLAQELGMNKVFKQVGLLSLIRMRRFSSPLRLG